MIVGRATRRSAACAMRSSVSRPDHPRQLHVEQRSTSAPTSAQARQRLLAARRLLDGVALALQHHAHVRRMFFSSSTMKTVEGMRPTAQTKVRDLVARARPRKTSRPPRRQGQRRRVSRCRGGTGRGDTRARRERGGAGRSRATRKASLRAGGAGAAVRRPRRRAAARVADQRDVVGARVKVRPAVERVDAVRVGEADLAQHASRPPWSRARPGRSAPARAAAAARRRAGPAGTASG